MAELTIVNANSWQTAMGPMPGNIEFVRPLPRRGAENGKCYRNVRQRIAREGGEAVYGWALTDYGPHRAFGGSEPPLYRRWLNHVVWRDCRGQLWEVTPGANLANPTELHFAGTEFVVDAEATFEIVSDDEWYTRPTRYVPLRAEGVRVAETLTRAQQAEEESERMYWLREALAALQGAGFRPREWKVEMIGARTGSIWLIAD